MSVLNFGPRTVVALLADRVPLLYIPWRRLLWPEGSAARVENAFCSTFQPWCGLETPKIEQP